MQPPPTAHHQTSIGPPLHLKAAGYRQCACKEDARGGEGADRSGTSGPRSVRAEVCLTSVKQELVVVVASTTRSIRVEFAGWAQGNPQDHAYFNPDHVLKKALPVEYPKACGDFSDKHGTTDTMNETVPVIGSTLARPGGGSTGTVLCKELSKHYDTATPNVHTLAMPGRGLHGIQQQQQEQQRPQQTVNNNHNNIHDIAKHVLVERAGSSNELPVYDALPEVESTPAEQKRRAAQGDSADSYMYIYTFFSFFCPAELPYKLLNTIAWTSMMP